MPAVPPMEAAPRRPLRRPPAAQGTVRAHRRRQEEARAVLPGVGHTAPQQPIPGRTRAAHLPAGLEQQGPVPAPVQGQGQSRAVNSQPDSNSHPRGRRPAAEHRHARQHRGALGDLLYVPAQGQECRPAKTRPVGQAVQAPPLRKQQAAFTNSRKRHSARQFLV